MYEPLADQVRERAGGCCEYCRLSDARHPGPFEIEHIIPKQHGSPTTAGNLAYSCLPAIVTRGQTSPESIAFNLDAASCDCFIRDATNGIGTSVGTGRFSWDDLLSVG